ncbi:OmpA family protein [Rhizobium brockwellii]|uniref:OmpA family protein n=1 Tax=Rhizobium brockwellii TaxID=3019932 RepID=UPI003F94A31A
MKPGASDGTGGKLTRSFKTRTILPHNPHEVQSETLALNIQFELNSAKLDSSAREKLAKLATALKDPSLDGQFFGISGYTDTSGSDVYNLELSKLRAEAVRQYLWSTFGVDASKLFTNGFGESQLRDAANPLSAENRRVEIFNMGSSQN